MQEPRPNSPGSDAGIDEDLIAKLVDRFYATVRQDALIGPVFEARVKDWDAHLTKLMAFWSSVVLKSGRYRGSPMPVHVAIDEICGNHFARWLQLFAETARDVCPPAAAALFIDRSQRIAETLPLCSSLSRRYSLACEK